MMTASLTHQPLMSLPPCPFVFSCRWVSFTGEDFCGLCCARTSWLRADLPVESMHINPGLSPAPDNMQRPWGRVLGIPFHPLHPFSSSAPLTPSMYFTSDSQPRQNPSTSSIRQLRVVSRLQMSSLDCSGKDITILSPCTVQ